MFVDGKCHCGAIRFSATVDPGKVMICHCSDCQILTGTAYRTVVPAPIANFRLEGEPQRYIRTSESGVKRVQAFCPVCGTPVFAMAAENPTQVSLRVGVLEQRKQLTPSLQIWKRSALPWCDTLSQIHGCERQEAFNAQ
ncbi:MAG TPA: GFA family protein [Paucimonas sp.]|nr:GFA family protein [Paucimonas sp.]